VRGDALAFARFCAGLPGFFRRPLEPAECRRRLVEGLAARETSVLRTLEHGVFRRPRSPYLRLLRHAGIELGDVAGSLREIGVEGTLGRLYDEGVRVTLEEFKGSRPIVRPGLELAVPPEGFDNPLLSPARFAGETVGSRGVVRRSLLDLPHLEQEAVYQWLFLETFALHDHVRALWRPVPPARAGLKNAVGYAKLGLPVERWFSQNPFAWEPGRRREYVATKAILASSRTFGAPIAEPEHVPLPNAVEVARWLELEARAGTPVLIDTVASSGVRACVAAVDHGLDLTGSVLRFGGEPLTDAKADIVARSGAKAVCHYSMSELARIGVACARPAAVDDVHLLLDKLAFVQRERELPGSTERIGALHLTTLLPSSPKLMLNVEVDDYGMLEERRCGCAVGELGFSLHLSRIRSYEKLTTEGMNYVGEELVTLVERILPARFGGSPADYQLVEEEVDGLSRVAIVVSPRLDGVDEAEVVQTVLAALSSGPSYRGMMASIWRDAGTLRVVRREPVATESAKVLPLHVERARRP
jgi:hypothetical protein